MNHDIRMEIEGSLPEKLLERALAQGAVFADVRRSGKRGIIVAADLRSAEILFALCRKYALNCRMLHRGGRAAAADFIRARWTIAPAICLCILLCCLFLSRIWLVDIQFTGPCAHLGSEAQLRAQLENEGIYPGMPGAAADTALLQKQLSAASGNYSFIGVRRQGIRLLVEASPEVPAPQLYAIDSARDLVAARSGVVESIAVYCGEAAVSAGDTVMRGDILIRGEETIGKDPETGEDITRAVRAAGAVTARCWVEGSAEGSLQSTVWRRTGESRTECHLKLMNLSLPISECEAYPSEDIETELLPVVGMFLPLEIERRIHLETTAETRRDDPEVLEDTLCALARADAFKKISSDIIAYETASSWTDIEEKNNTLYVRTVYEIYTDIAADRDALIEEVY